MRKVSTVFKSAVLQTVFDKITLHSSCRSRKRHFHYWCPNKTVRTALATRGGGEEGGGTRRGYYGELEKTTARQDIAATHTS